MIRSEVGTKVTISIYRADTKENKDITITRDTIKIPTLDTKIQDGVYIIQLYNFSAESPELFRDALNAFIATNLNRLVIDLRGNPEDILNLQFQWRVSSYLKDQWLFLKNKVS